jgi:hypothetical protein
MLCTAVCLNAVAPIQGRRRGVDRNLPRGIGNYLLRTAPFCCVRRLNCLLPCDDAAFPWQRRL